MMLPEANPKPTPRPDQIADLAWFINNPKSGLLHDPGVGKTITAALYTQYAHDYLGYLSAWVQPKSLLKKNREEIIRFTNFKPWEVVIVQGSPEKRKKLMEGPGKVFLFTPEGWSREHEIVIKAHPNLKVNICDEIHLYYAGHKSARTIQWYKACWHMKSVIPMSGTIIKGKLSSVYPVLHVIGPQFYGSYESFLAQHAVMDDYGSVLAWKNHEKLKKVLGSISIRRSFESVYGKESPVIQIEKCEMSPLQYKRYKELEETALIELEDRFIEVNSPGVTAIRARQILAHPEAVKLPETYDEEGKVLSYKTYNLLGKEELTGKDERLRIHIEDHLNSGERLVIFAAFVAEQERIVRLIQSMGGDVRLINGSVSGPERQKIDADFRENKFQFVVGSAVTMGVGFNWPFLNTIIFASLDYGDDTFTQAYKRGIRGKRQTPLLVLILEYEDSIDRRIFEIVQQKSRDYSQVDETKEEIFAQQKQEAFKMK